MPTLTTAGFTLRDVANRHDPDGDLAVIAEVIEEENEIMLDAIWTESNDTFSHTGTRRSSYPTGTNRKLNAGIANEKSEVIQVTNTIAILESEAKHDARIIKAAANPTQFRDNENRAHMAGLAITQAGNMMYGNTNTAPENFTGLAPRLASLSTTSNVLNEGGSGSDLTSIFVVTWGLTEVFMVFPKNSQAGLQHQNMGLQIVQDSDKLDYRALVDFFTWEAGMHVQNEKCIGRLANIETTGAVNTFDEDNLITLTNRMKVTGGTRYYVNDTIKTQMEIRLKDKANVNLTVANGLAPGPVLMFKGHPVRLVDQIVITESELS